MRRLRFDGWIAGIGTSGGIRLVLGHWPVSPFGPVSDVMVEYPDGRRVLLAPTAELGRFVADTYSFEEVRVVPVAVTRTGRAWTVTAGPLTLRFSTGGRGALGRLLRAVPAPLARRGPWVRLIDRPARLLRGVRTYGSAGNGRREWYAAQDLHRIVTAGGELDDADLGRLTAIDPPVRFGFGSTPRFPALVRVTTTVELPGTRVGSGAPAVPESGLD
ncbi:hypothetical protein BJY16_005739 [Actinoplanes octamycinicus]|uniref:Uncharacterized protein n=1 Tax=Actinoplanes octamycinicus TaxID=135948 RepID=A0A7W7H1I8_9ACTN|nr:hypothetical protein [Actinoplanes octamycinicus]MBB4742280.1 hypothetical protein [Actinoplanes octamycinicus]GIE59875.1 hypothetical protein Aoc01nite_52770 [Actinoplanes octamycinicus]